MRTRSKYNKNINITIHGFLSTRERTEYPRFFYRLGFEIVTNNTLHLGIHNRMIFLQKYKKFHIFSKSACFF